MMMKIMMPNGPVVAEAEDVEDEEAVVAANAAAAAPSIYTKNSKSFLSFNLMLIVYQ